jgi:sugar phosphate isomerase/epimerase
VFDQVVQPTGGKLAFSTLGCPGWSVQQVADNAREYGYQGVELRLLDGELIDSEMPAGERERVARIFKQAGLPIATVDTSIRIAGQAQPDGADGVDAQLERWLELASAWESPFVRVFGGPYEDSEEEAVARAAGVLERAAPRAEALGVAVVLETHDSFASGARVGPVLDRVQSPSVGALWDTHHPFRSGETPEQTWDLLSGRVLHVHVKDARRRSDDGWDLVLLGEGEVPVAETLALLTSKGYDGWVSVEWEKKWHPEIPEPEIALPQHAELLRQWLGHKEAASG